MIKINPTLAEACWSAGQDLHHHRRVFIYYSGSGLTPDVFTLIKSLFFKNLAARRENLLARSN